MPQRFLDNRFRKYPNGSVINLKYVRELKERYEDAELPVPKYVLFCEYAILKGFHVKIYEAQETVSKYVRVFWNDIEYKVRFSNHPPSIDKEMTGDCDFFVGRTNLGIKTTRDAWYAMIRYFKEKGWKPPTQK